MKITETQARAYTSAEAAERLGIKRDTLIANYKKMGIPYIMIGRRLLFPIGKFECWRMTHREDVKHSGKPD